MNDTQQVSHVPLPDGLSGEYEQNRLQLRADCYINGNNDGDSGGIYNGNGIVNFNNSIIWNNQDNSGMGTVAASSFINGGSLTFSHSLVQGHNPTGAGNLNGTLSSNDPLFVASVSPDNAPTTSGDYRLSTGSPAVDVGSNNLVPVEVNTDLDGNQRIANGFVNLVAYETVVVSSALPVDCNDDGSVNAADISTLVLRLFDPTLHDNPGCDANSDGFVSAADISAAVILTWRQTLKSICGLVSNMSKTLFIRFPTKQGRELLCEHYALW